MDILFAMSVWIDRTNYPSIAIAFYILVFCIFVYVWARFAIKLSDVGVVDSVKRSLFLAILVPLALVISVAVAPLLIAITPLLPVVPDVGIWVWPACWIVVAACVALGRRAAYWVSGHSKSNGSWARHDDTGNDAIVYDVDADQRLATGDDKLDQSPH